MAASSITRPEKKWRACTSLLYAGPADDGGECGEGTLLRDKKREREKESHFLSSNDFLRWLTNWPRLTPLFLFLLFPLSPILKPALIPSDQPLLGISFSIPLPI